MEKSIIIKKETEYCLYYASLMIMNEMQGKKILKGFARKDFTFPVFLWQISTDYRTVFSFKPVPLLTNMSISCTPPVTIHYIKKKILRYNNQNEPYLCKINFVVVYFKFMIG